VSREAGLEWERRNARWAAITAVIGPLLFVVSQFILAGMLGADNDAQNLRDIDEESGTFILANVTRALGAAMLAFPLYYLFRAVALRSDSFRRQMVGVVIAAPLFIAIGMVLTAIANADAASAFVAEDPGGTGENAQDLADDKVTEASLTGLAIGFNLGGRLGLAITMVYVCLHALRTGLLTRFWASLGMALGVVSFVFLPFFMFLLIWFVYVGVMVSGRTPGGKPPAWDEGRAIPWPSPGEAMAEQMAARNGDDDEDDVIGTTGEPANPPRQRGERRKRKRRT
jgi:hypothetical protein